MFKKDNRSREPWPHAKREEQEQKRTKGRSAHKGEAYIA